MRTIAMLIAGSLLSGCTSSMIRSYSSTTLPASSNLELIGQYGLVTSKVQVTVSVPGAGGGGDKDAAPAGVNFNSAITFNNTAAKPEAKEEKKDTPKVVTQASICADIRKVYNEDRVSQLASYKRHADFLATVRVWRRVLPSSKEQKSAALNQLSNFLSQRAQDFAAAERAANLFGVIPQCPQPIVIELKEIVETGNETYRLYATRGAMADNNITVELAGGYIKTVNATAEDRTADVISEAAKSLGTISTIGQPLPLKVMADQRNDAVASAQSFADAEDQLTKAVAALQKQGLSKATVDALERALVGVMSEFKKTVLPAIDAQLPFTKVYSLDELTSGQSIHDLLGVTLTTTCSSSKPTASELAEPTGKRVKYYEGLLISGQRNCTAVAKRIVRTITGAPGSETETTTPEVVGRISFAAADASIKSQLAVPRQSFAKTTSIYTFDGGRLVKSETIRPSPFVTAVALPGRAIGGFLGGVTGGLNGKKDAAEAENARVDAEIKRVTKAKELQELRKPDSEEEETPDGESPQ